jgi:D-tyrosyl-tRNA(Tyr) deacylase
MRSRWTDFLTSDGEKPDRQRDTEFEAPAKTRQETLEMWESGWKLLFNALTSLTDADLERKITIRNEPHSVMQAVNRQIAHYAYHVGQIVYLSRHFARDQWKSLTIPKKKSADLDTKVSGSNTRRDVRAPSESLRR